MNKYLKTMKKNYVYGIMAILIILSVVLGIILYKEKEKYTIATQNQYNLAFYEVVDYVQDVENYLAKATVSGSYENEADTLMHVWREANLAQAYLAQLPIASNELASTAKFLNQVSEYSYSLSSKSINRQDLTQEELDNLKMLHDYSKELKNVLNQLSEDMNSGRISWKELTKNADTAFAQQVDNLSAVSFSNLDENFGEYAGLIYDGAYSEHIENVEKKGLVGEEIDEEKAKQIAIEFIGQDRIIDITSNGLVENGNIVVYDFSARIKDGEENNPFNISISKKGGHVVLANYNRNIQAEVISQDDANRIGQEFLTSRGIPNMKATYYLKQAGVVTINYAYVQDDVTIYSDLVKLKIALDNGEILGMETKGYLNNHEIRNIPEANISMQEAEAKLNKHLEITSRGLAITPTEWRTEVFCYEFKGKIDETDFLVYVNAETGEEENILVIIETPNGILTQ